jgi:hypothetical protein
VSFSEEGLNSHFSQYVTYSGCQRDEGQGCNIFLGGYTKAVVDSNFLSHAFTFNIADFGTYNYIIDNTAEYGGYSAHTQRWIPGSYDANGLWQITPAQHHGWIYTGALPDTATVLNYGTFYNGRADRTIPMDSARRWLRGNIISNERIMDINDVNKYVITLYSSPSTVGPPPWPGGGAAWAKDNRTWQNSYNGVLVAGFPYIRTDTYTPAIDLSEKLIPYIPIVSAGRDMRITENFWELSGNVFPWQGIRSALLPGHK